MEGTSEFGVANDPQQERENGRYARRNFSCMDRITFLSTRMAYLDDIKELGHIIVPKQLRPLVLKELHENIGHLVVDDT